MAREQRLSIEQQLNGPRPAPSPAPGPSPSAPPAPPAASPPPPARWPTPAPPSTGATGSITYTESALNRFAQTSDERASSFSSLSGRAGQIRVSRDAFGYMFGALVHSAYQSQAQSVTDGLKSAEMAMTSIATAMRESADRIRAVDESTEQALGQINGDLGQINGGS